ncbi:MAG: hypothetical protein JRC86_12655 [Deltaproteobacteria bacterium]|nr:hypothetical protein [Deltaproteobacteria bacterium]
MAMSLGDKVKLFIENAAGEVIEIPVISVEYSIEAPMDGPITGDVGFKMIGPPTMFTRDDFVKKSAVMRSAAEWACTFCERPNKRERETCGSCGAVRSFIYG